MRSLFLGGSDGRTDGLTAGRTYGRTDADGRTYGRTDVRTYGRTADGRPFRQAYAIDGSSARRARHDQIKVSLNLFDRWQHGSANGERALLQ